AKFENLTATVMIGSSQAKTLIWSEYTGSVSNSRTRFCRLKRPDLSYVVSTVLLANIFVNFPPLIFGKVQVNIRQPITSTFKEPFKQQHTVQRAHVYDTQDIGDDRTCR